MKSDFSSPARSLSPDSPVAKQLAASSAATHRSRDKNPEIEALRAYAIIITLVAHLGSLFPAWIQNLALFWLGGGVDLFFCISGYVITASIIRQKAAKGDSFLHFAAPFWIRRMFRLWPAGWFWIVFSVICATIFNRSNAFGPAQQTFTTGVAAVMQVANLHVISCTSLHAATCAGNTLWPYWSLSLEEQFYILFPPVFFLLRRRYLALVAVTGIAMQFLTIRTWPSPLWFIRTDAILWGILIALGMHSGSLGKLDLGFLFRLRLRRPLALLAATLLVIVAQPDVAWFYWSLTALVSAILVFLAAFDQGYLLAGGWVLRAGTFIGARSYSLYLTHMPAFALSREIAFRFNTQMIDGGRWNPGLAILASVLLGVFTEFSYRIIERPLRRIGRDVANGVLPNALPSEAGRKEPGR